MNRRMRSCWLVLVLVTRAATASAQDNTADAKTLIDVLQLKPGSVVAETGAGGGELTLAIARHVGSAGHVYTSELGSERIAKLRDAVAHGGAGNVQVVEGRENEANLPEGCCDAIFMRNVYHHFGAPPLMIASFLRALKPGGRIAVIDFPPRNNAATAPPGKRGADSAHGVSAETVASELSAGGFEIVASEERPNRWFLVVGAKPR
jgi:ubiquinone/menaquinone biosynthesis C-methylase UbiE